MLGDFDAMTHFLSTLDGWRLAHSGPKASILSQNRKGHQDCSLLANYNVDQELAAKRGLLAP